MSYPNLYGKTISFYSTFMGGFVIGKYTGHEVLRNEQSVAILVHPDGTMTRAQTRGEWFIEILDDAVDMQEEAKLSALKLDLINGGAEYEDILTVINQLRQAKREALAKEEEKRVKAIQVALSDDIWDVITDDSSGLLAKIPWEDAITISKYLAKLGWNKG